MILVCFRAHEVPSEKGSALNGKHLLPSEGRQNSCVRVVSLEIISVYNPLIWLTKRPSTRASRTRKSKSVESGQSF